MSYYPIAEGSSSSSPSQIHIDPNDTYSSRKGKEKYSANTPLRDPEETNPLVTPALTYGAIEPNENHRSQKTCAYIALSITTCTILLLFCLLWMTPSFAERTIQDGVSFQFQRASIVNVTQDNVITMHVVGQIELKSDLFHLQQKVNSFFGEIGVQQSDLQVHYTSSSMGTIQLPELQLNSRSNVTSFDFVTQFVIDDSDALMAFCKDAVTAHTIVWRITGPLSVSFGWVPWVPKVALDKSIDIEGMNGLNQTDMKSMIFPGPHPLGGIEVMATVGIYNPSSILSLTLGDVNFGIYLPASQEGDDVEIAVVQAHQANLEGRRMNYFNVTGRTLPIPDEDTTSQRLMESFLTRYLHGNATDVHVRGSRFGPDDQPKKKHVSPIPHWLQEALASVVLRVPFPGAEETNLIQSLQLNNIKIDFSPLGSPLISGDALAYLKKPKEMQFHLDVKEVEPTVYLFLNQDSPKPFAMVQPNRPCPAKTYEGNGLEIPLGTLKLTSRIYRAPFKVLPGGQKDFEEFLSRVFNKKKGTVYIQGRSDARIESAFGNLNIRDLEFNGQIETKGMQGMQHPPPQTTYMKLMKGHKDAIEAQVGLDIFNPSDVDINLGSLNMMVLFGEHIIGNTTIPEFNLVANSHNDIVASAMLFADNPYVLDFVGQYISEGINLKNKEASLTISGQHPNASQSEFLNQFLQHMTFSIPVPPFDEEPLLADCQVNIMSSTVVMSLRNPFENIQIAINKINASAAYEIYEIGKLQANFEDHGEGWKGPLILPPAVCDQEECKGIVVESEKIPVIAKRLGYDAIKKALGGSIQVSVDSRIGLMIDQFEMKDLKYQQSNITTKVRKGF
ncbi:hypothetical protein A0J61_09455 [Choanephora cucurbitarum]|uniref:Tag1-like fifth Ig-like domain-containing protein n=1 Tax=Choanephora cucurbitarum TaxID=101091 RepID=A0A1C7N1C5_9FUNG|nr:hypothetical protein A0J61_09455 [Choanephora cucurbitarum]